MAAQGHILVVANLVSVPGREGSDVQIRYQAVTAAYGPENGP
jgi:hypothetical protein